MAEERDIRGLANLTKYIVLPQALANSPEMTAGMEEYDTKNPDHKLRYAQLVKIVGGDVKLEAGDISIGAVELKDSDTDTRATIKDVSNGTAVIVGIVDENGNQINDFAPTEIKLKDKDTDTKATIHQFSSSKTAIMAGIVDEHGDQVVDFVPISEGTPGSAGKSKVLQIGGIASGISGPLSVVDGKTQRLWMDTKGRLVLLGCDVENELFKTKDVDTASSVPGEDPVENIVQLGGIASGVSGPTMVPSGKAIQLWITRKGELVIAGYDKDDDSIRTKDTDTTASIPGSDAVDNITQLGGIASTDVPDAVEDGKSVKLWINEKGQLVLAGYDKTSDAIKTQDSAANAPGAQAVEDVVQLGGVASTTSPTAVNNGETVKLWINEKGQLVLAGYDENKDLLKTQEVDTVAGTPNEDPADHVVQLGGIVSEDTPTPVADGKVVKAWMTPEGKLVLAGYDKDSDQLKTQEASTGTPGEAAVPQVVQLGGVANTNIPDAVANGQTAKLWLNEYGQLVLAGYSVSDDSLRVTMTNDATLLTLGPIKNLDAAVADGAAASVNVAGYHNITIDIYGEGNMEGTVYVEHCLDGEHWVIIDQHEYTGTSGNVSFTYENKRFEFIRTRLAGYVDGTVTTLIAAGN